MSLQKWALWVETKKCHRDILTMVYLRITLNFGGTFEFQKLAAKSGQHSKNGNFQNLFFEFSTHNCRYSHETLCDN
jgi:hypothetical protein